MSADAFDEVIQYGIGLVHQRLCPACDMVETRTVLVDDPPLERFHYHGQTEFVDPPYLWCPADGQGYRIDNGTMKILPPCNGGLHPEDVRPARPVFVRTEDWPVLRERGASDV